MQQQQKLLEEERQQQQRKLIDSQEQLERQKLLNQQQIDKVLLQNASPQKYFAGQDPQSQSYVQQHFHQQQQQQQQLIRQQQQQYLLQSGGYLQSAYLGTNPASMESPAIGNTTSPRMPHLTHMSSHQRAMLERSRQPIIAGSSLAQLPQASQQTPTMMPMNHQYPASGLGFAQQQTMHLLPNGANLSGANLSGANLSTLPGQPSNSNNPYSALRHYNLH